ncbi:hypothetical protein ACLK1S_09215 [Escherichia coli]
MMYLPRLRTLPQSQLRGDLPERRQPSYKREEDGIVLIDRRMRRGWRLCTAVVRTKKIYFNWKSGKSEK